MWRLIAAVRSASVTGGSPSTWTAFGISTPSLAHMVGLGLDLGHARPLLETLGTTTTQTAVATRSECALWRPGEVCPVLHGHTTPPLTCLQTTNRGSPFKTLRTISILPRLLIELKVLRQVHSGATICSVPNIERGGLQQI